MTEENKKLTREKIKVVYDTILKEVKRYKKQTIILVFLSIISAFGNGLIPYITGRFFDSIITLGKTYTFLGYTFPVFVVLLALWLLIQLVTSLVDWRVSIRTLVLNHNIWTNYLSEGIGRILMFPVSFFKDNNSSALTHKLDMSASAICETFVIGISKTFPKLLSLVIALIVCYYINPLLMLTLLAGLFLFSIVMIFSVKPLVQFQDDFWDKMNTTWMDFSGAFDNTQTIKQFGTEKYEQNRISKIFRDWLMPAFIKKDSVRSNLDFFQKTIITITQFAIFCVSLGLLYKNSISIGDLLAFNAYTAMAFGPLLEFGYDWHNIIGGIVSISDTEKTLRLPTENYQPKDHILTDTINGNISFKNVYFNYDEGTPILKDVSFEIKQGDVIALVGESGVGKSTLIDLISGYNFPTSGNISIDNIPVQKLDLTFLRKNIGIVPQEVVLFNDTLKKNICYGNFETSEEEILAVMEKTGLLSFVEKLPKRLETVVGERGVKLSVGQKQRIAIARAMLKNPKILILDEPTSALDASTEKLITDSLEMLMEGKTTFIIAHRLSTVKKATTIFVVKDGRIVEANTHDNLLKIKDGEYRRLYDLQIGLHK